PTTTPFRDKTSGKNLLLAENDAPFGEIVWRKLHLHAIARQNADEVLAHFPGDDAQYLAVGVVKLELEHGVRQRLRNSRFNLNRLALGHAHNSLVKMRWYAGTRPGASRAAESIGQRRHNPLKRFASPRRRSGGGNVREEFRQIVSRHVPQSEQLHAWRIDHGAADVQGVMAGGSGRVPAFFRVAADGGDAKIEVGLDRADEAGFSDAAVAGQ